MKMQRTHSETVAASVHAIEFLMARRSFVPRTQQQGNEREYPTRTSEALMAPTTTFRDKDSDTGAIWLWHIVDELTAELSAPDHHTISAAISSGLADGWLPTSTEVTNLVNFARQQATAAEHSSGGARHRAPTHSRPTHRESTQGSSPLPPRLE
ncbi:hypothetical protein [Mycolicibacter arupensis]|nr:hypothetical protein [Mycolicibacter arupensis]MCV7274926.1 hypothetical protein [Mycolicibacter arupensis]